MGKKLDKVKEHIYKHKSLYIVGVVSLSVGIVGTLCFKNGLHIQIVDAIKLQIASPTTNNIIQTNLVRAGHSGNIIICDQTGVAFPSQNQAAAAYDINPARLSEYLNGKRSEVNGFTFTKIKEAK